GFPRPPCSGRSGRGFASPRGLFLLFDGAGAPGGARERAAGDRGMVGLLGELQPLQRLVVLLLPVEPLGQPRNRLALGRGCALDAERIAGILALCARDPASAPLQRFDPAVHRSSSAPVIVVDRSISQSEARR